MEIPFEDSVTLNANFRSVLIESIHMGTYINAFDWLLMESQFMEDTKSGTTSILLLIATGRQQHWKQPKKPTAQPAPPQMKKEI